MKININPFKRVKKKSEELTFIEKCRAKNVLRLAYKKYNKYLAIIDKDPDINEQCRKLDDLFNKTDDHNMRLELIDKYQELIDNKLGELIQTDFNKAKTKKERLVIFFTTYGDACKP